MKDMLFSEEQPIMQKFAFDEKVTEVFDDMLVRSIPFYEEIQRMVGELVIQFYQQESLIYDLGCSTGNLLAYLADIIKPNKVNFIGVDSSAPMLQKAKEKLSDLVDKNQIEFICSDIADVGIEKSSVVVMNYTLQFIAPQQRLELLKRIYNGLYFGGVLIISEKVISSDSDFRNLELNFYENFKRRKGYSDMEIARKRQALDNVLVPLSVENNIEMLRQAGFSIIETIFKWYNFVTFLAIKN